MLLQDPVARGMFSEEDILDDRYRDMLREIIKTMKATGLDFQQAANIGSISGDDSPPAGY